jgi:protein-disulfide isomerase
MTPRRQDARVIDGQVRGRQYHSEPPGGVASCPRAVVASWRRAVVASWRPRARASLGAIALFALLPGGASAQQPEAYLPARTKGVAEAPVTVIELSDFQCPYCRRHATEAFPAIDKEYIATGKVRWVFLNFPLTQIHPNASVAAQFALCAAKAGKFWPVHDLLFTYQDKWAPLKDPAPFLLTLADSVGISRTEITSCLQSDESRDLVREEAEGAARSGVASTPSFYVQGVGLLKGAAPIEAWRRFLDSLVKERSGK